MRKTTKIDIRKPKSQDSSDISLACSCEILCDTSLSGVSDSECDCSQCLEANLNAFNEFKLEEEGIDSRQPQRQANNKRSQAGQSDRGKSSGQDPTYTKQNRGQYHSTSSLKSGDDKATKTHRFVPKKKWQEDMIESKGDPSQGEIPEKATDEQLNEYLIITRNRTRKYMQEVKKLKSDEKSGKEQLKQKIKTNLELLRMTAEMKRNDKEIKEWKHPDKWNHSIYECKCNRHLEQAAKDTARDPAREGRDCGCKARAKRELDTNLDKYIPNYKEHKQEILKGFKQAQIKEEAGPCPYDQCRNHHNRTDPKKIKKIQKFINRQARKYTDQQHKKKLREAEQKKTKQAKLRAIALKSREIVERSKRIDYGVSRTSFKNSIDQFETFSELREENNRRKEARKNRRKIEMAMKREGGDLERAIYHELEEEEEGLQEECRSWVEEHPQSKKIGLPTGLKKQDLGPENSADEGFCQKIVYDAKVRPPKELRKTKLAEKKGCSKREQQIHSRPETRKTCLMNFEKEQQAKRQIEKEIEQKRRQIMAEYANRNTYREPANRAVREGYEETRKAAKQTKNTQQDRKNNHDPFRTQYSQQAGRNKEQINAHGDPLLQEYVYDDGQRLKAVARVSDPQIFTQNINSLTGKHRLKL